VFVVPSIALSGEEPVREQNLDGRYCRSIFRLARVPAAKGVGNTHYTRVFTLPINQHQHHCKF